MKIGIDIRTLMEAQYSGVSEYAYNLITNLLEQDSDNEYVLFYNSFKDVSDIIPKFRGNYKIIKTRYPNKIFNFLLQKIFKYPKLDKLLGVNVFIAPNIGFYALSKSCLKILTVHDLSFLRYPEFFSAKRILWHKIINVKKQIKKFDKIVAVSDNTKNDLVELCEVDERKIKVIYPGVETQNLAFLQNNGVHQTQNHLYLKSVQIKYNLPDKFILYLGTIEPRKNIISLIKAYNELRFENNDFQHKLVLAGGNGWKTKKIYQEWQKSKYQKDIIFTGYVNNEDKVGLYKLADVFVYPSFYEGFGFPPLEAMAYETPVITSFSSSLPEILGSSAIMVDPYNIEDLRQAISELLLNKNLQDNFKNKGLEKVKEFSWEKVAKDYIALFV